MLQLLTQIYFSTQDMFTFNPNIPKMAAKLPKMVTKLPKMAINDLKLTKMAINGQFQCFKEVYS